MNTTELYWSGCYRKHEVQSCSQSAEQELPKAFEEKELPVHLIAFIMFPSASLPLAFSHGSQKPSLTCPLQQSWKGQTPLQSGRKGQRTKVNVYSAENRSRERPLPKPSEVLFSCVPSMVCLGPDWKVATFLTVLQQLPRRHLFSFPPRPFVSLA